MLKPEDQFRRRPISMNLEVWVADALDRIVWEYRLKGYRIPKQEIIQRCLIQGLELTEPEGRPEPLSAEQLQAFFQKRADEQALREEPLKGPVQ